jgi:hypothetical protein
MIGQLMDVSHLEEFHKLCPDKSYLSVRYQGNNPECIINLLKFEHMKQFYFETKFGAKFQIKDCSKLLKSLKEDNKLEEVTFSSIQSDKQEEICEFYETLFEKVKVKKFERMKNVKTFIEESVVISSWIEKSSTLKSIDLKCLFFLLNFQVGHTPVVGYLDLIFKALDSNIFVKSLNISHFSLIELNLNDSESLRFIEMNSCLENLNLSSINFKEIEIKLIGEYLINNKSITKLNLSNSNYSGSLDFLKNNILKEFSFKEIWKIKEQNSYMTDFQNFFDNFKANKSIKVLNLSYGFQSTICNPIVDDFINIMSEHEGNVEELTLNRMFNSNETLNFHKLLKNKKIKKLELNELFTSKTCESMAKFLLNLKDNDNLTSLDLSENDIGESNEAWDKIQISHKGIETLNLSSKQITILKKECNFDFSKNLNFFKCILDLPSLKDLDIEMNILGNVGMNHLCEFLKENGTLKYLTFSSKQI